MTSLPRLPLPPFSSTTFNNNAGILSTKHIFPEENSTIFGKIWNLFSEHLKKRNVIDGHFVKCNYLEELVERDKLNYMIVSFYPQRVVYSVKEHNKEPRDVIWRSHFSEEEELYSFINNEEVPIHFLLLCQKYGWDLFYDFHVILKIEMFASVDKEIDPYISTFILLKPTSYFIGKEKLVNWNVDSPEEDAKVIALPEEEYLCHQEVRNKSVSEVCVRLDPHLCLRASPIEEFSTNVFASSSSNSLIEQGNLPNQKKRRIIHEDEFRNSKKKEAFLHLEQSEKEKEEDDDEKKCTPFFYVDMRSKLKSLLESREMFSEEIYLREKDCAKKTILPCCHLVEVFTFEYISRKIKDCFKFIKDEINVYVENDCFYTFVKKCDSVLDPNEDRKLCCVSTRKNLDKFILAFATSVSKRFCKLLRISYKNHRDDNEVPFFFCADNGYDYENEVENVCMRMKKMKALFTSEGKKFEKEADSKDKSDSAVFNDAHMDVLNSSHGDSPMETSEIEGEPVIPGFEEESNLEKSEAENLPSSTNKEIESTSTRKGEPVSQGARAAEHPYEEEKSKEKLSEVSGKKSETSYTKRIILSEDDLWSYGSFAFLPKPDTSGE